MRLTKKIQTTLSISSTALYSDIDELVLLKETYEGVCYSGCLILEIVEVLEKSHIRIIIDDRSCPGSIDLTFNAIVEEYAPGDIIIATVVKQLGGAGPRLLCTSEYCAISANVNKLAAAFKPGDKIPVQVKSVEYLIGKSLSNIKPISVNAEIPNFRPVPFVIVKISKPVTDIIEPYVKIYKQLEEKFAALAAEDKKKMAEFKACLYPYKRNKQPAFDTSKTIELKELDQIKAGDVMCFPPEYPRASIKMVVVKDPEHADLKHASRIESTGDMFVIEGLLQCIKYMTIAIDMFHHLDKVTVNETMRVYWGMANSLKED